MSEAKPQTDHEAAKRIHDLLKREIKYTGEKSKLIQHLKEEHPDVYDGLISECKTHGPGIKGKIREFVADSSKVLPKERMDGVRKALQVVEEHPELLTQAKSKMGWWIAGVTSAAGIGAYIISQYGKSEPPKPMSQQNSWVELAQYDATNERKL